MDFFSTGLSDASNSMLNNANLISKIYFPRLIVPTATVVAPHAGGGQRARPSLGRAL